MSFSFLVLMCCGMAAQAEAQPAGRAPIASNPVVELKGKVARVQLGRGQGMPYLEVASGKEITKVYLGSMRYLMQQNFNPKVDSEVSLKGYKVEKDIFAISVNSGGRELKLRDDSGRPVWCGGCGGGPGRGRMGMGRW